MPMPKEEHEKLLNDLLLPELEHSRRTEILLALRTDYGTVLADHKDLTDTKTKLTADNQDLIISNSKLFRQIGITGNDTKEKEVVEKEFSETVTLESLEK